MNSAYRVTQEETLPTPRRLFRLYHERGIWQTCNRFDAIQLLKEGKWHDKTKYSANEEVLTYENESQEQERSGNGSHLQSKQSDKAPRKRKKSKH